MKAIKMHEDSKVIHFELPSKKAAFILLKDGSGVTFGALSDTGYININKMLTLTDEDFKEAIALFDPNTPPEYMHVIKTLGNVIDAREREIKGLQELLEKSHKDYNQLSDDLAKKIAEEESTQKINAVVCVKVISSNSFVKDFIHVVHDSAGKPTVDVLNRIREFYSAKDAEYVGIHSVTIKLGDPIYAKIPERTKKLPKRPDAGFPDDED